MMKTNLLSAAIAALTLALASSPALADDAANVTAAQAERQNSVNVSPLGLLVGSYTVNYERLLSGGHGVLVEGAYSNSRTTDSSAAGAGAAVGYRWHWRGKQDSGFLGATLAYSAGTGDGTVTTNGMEETFEVDTKALTATANIGRRWAWDTGLNITLRFGLGYGNYTVTTESTDPAAQDAVELVDDLLTIIPLGVEGELSVGYTF